MSEQPATGSPLVVVGEALVDIVVPAGADPTDATAVTEAVGGSPMNVAVGLARLDVPAVLVTRIGDDPRGRRVAEHVRESGALLSPDSVVPGTRTSTATALLDGTGAATYDFDLHWDLPRQVLPDAAGLHVGSLGASLSPGRTAVLDLVRQAVERDLMVSYDPNMRPALMGDPVAAWQDVVEIARQSTLVKLSDEDAQALRPDLSLDEVAGELLRGERTELVMVTLGGDGAAAHTSRVSVQVAPPRSFEVVDTVGAGDSFMAAALASLLTRGLGGAARLRALGEAEQRSLLLDAITAASITCSRRGANPPTRRELPSGWPGL